MSSLFLSRTHPWQKSSHEQKKGIVFLEAPSTKRRMTLVGSQQEENYFVERMPAKIALPLKDPSNIESKNSSSLEDFSSSVIDQLVLQQNQKIPHCNKIKEISHCNKIEWVEVSWESHYPNVSWNILKSTGQIERK